MMLATGCKAEGASESPAPSAAPQLAAPTPPPERGAGGATAPGSSVSCEHFCGRLEAVRCGPVATCIAACDEMTKVAACRKALAAFFACAHNEPVEGWECDGPVAGLKDGRCEAAQASVARCSSQGS